MSGRRRSGLASHRRAYGCSCPNVPTTYTVTYNGNTNTSGTAPADVSPPYTTGSIVTVLGNTGLSALVKSGFTFAGWNTAVNGSGTSYLLGNTFAITANTTLYAQWTPIPPPPPPIISEAVGGNQAAYILFTQVGTVTNYEYSTDGGYTFTLCDPPQTYSPVEINMLSFDGITRLTNGTVYSVKLKAVRSGASSVPSTSVDVTPTVTSLLPTNRIIHLDANNPSSYSGTGTAWTNLVSNGLYSATLNGSPTFNTTDPSNIYFEFNPDTFTGQNAQIGQAGPINPSFNNPFTIQLWARINNVGAQGSLVSKMYGDGEGRDYDGYNFIYKTDTTLQLHLNGGSRDNRFPSVAGVLTEEWTLYTANVQFGNGGGRENKIFVNARPVMRVLSTETSVPSPTKDLTLASGFGGFARCDIGQFYYYDTQLSITQVIQNYDATKSMYIDVFYGATPPDGG